MDTTTYNIRGVAIECREVHGRPEYRIPGGRIWWHNIADALAEAREALPMAELHDSSDVW